VVEEMLFFTIA